MPTLLGHIAVPVTARIGLGRMAIPPGLLALGLLLSILPDADVIAFRFGIAYASPWGHRGVTHSLVFAVAVAALTALTYSQLTNARPWRPFFYFLVCALSHPLLDACTNAGHGVALLWPFSETRFFFSFRPIEVSPLTVQRFFGERGLRVLRSELLWVWLPCLTIGAAVYFGRKRRATRTQTVKSP